jgi:bacillolysin
MTQPLAIVLLAVFVIACQSREETSAPTAGSERTAVGTSAEATVTSAVDELKQQYPDLTLRLDLRSRVPETIEFGTAISAQSAGDARLVAQNFLDQNADRLFALPAAADLRIVAQERDPHVSGRSIFRVQQTVGGVPVFGGELILAVKTGEKGGLETLTSTISQTGDLKTTPSLSESAAIERASSAHQTQWSQLPAAEKIGEPDNSTPVAQLVVFDPTKVGLEGAPTLTFLVSIGTFKYFVDATDGGIRYSYRDLPHALNRKTFECASRPCSLVLTENRQHVLAVSIDARELHRFGEEVYKYFLDSFGRQGFDDKGSGGKADTLVNALVLGLKNAKYQPLAKEFLFERGWAARDLYAHEFTHAIAMHRPSLLYTFEAGAVSEYLADFFAAMIDLRSKASPWKIGEEASGLPGGRTVLRDLANPHSGHFDRNKDFDEATNYGQPESMAEYVRRTDRICASIPPNQDSGCVHFNGAILARASVFAVDGGANRNVSAVGAAKMQQIVYWAAMELPNNPTLASAAAGQIRKCNELAKIAKFGITTTDCNNLTQALKAVGL